MAHPSPSWPTLGQVQKLTDMFEEKNQPPKMPKILKNPVPMPKLNTDLMVRIKTALGEEVEPPKTPMEPPKTPMEPPKTPREPPKPPKTAMEPPKPPKTVKATITEDFYEVQTIDDASVIGDGGDSVAVSRNQCPRTHRNF